MPERPLLVLPKPGQPVRRAKGRGFPPDVNRPSRERQGERLAPRFAALQQAIESHRARFQLDAQALVPEVLEELVPYALVITLEVAEDLLVDIYDEVRTAAQAARLRV